MEVPESTYRFGSLLFALGVLNQMTMVARLHGTLPLTTAVILTLACVILVHYYAKASDTWNGLLYSGVVYSVGILAIFKVFPTTHATPSQGN